MRKYVYLTLGGWASTNIAERQKIIARLSRDFNSKDLLTVQKFFALLDRYSPNITYHRRKLNGRKTSSNQ